MKNLLIANQKVFILPFNPKHASGKVEDEVLAVNHNSHIALDTAKQVIYFCNEDLTLIGYSLVDEKVC